MTCLVYRDAHSSGTTSPSAASRPATRLHASKNAGFMDRPCRGVFLPLALASQNAGIMHHGFMMPPKMHVSRTALKIGASCMHHLKHERTSCLSARRKSPADIVARCPANCDRRKSPIKSPANTYLWKGAKGPVAHESSRSPRWGSDSGGA